VAAIIDQHVGRNYRALKLALWLTERSYWQGGLTQRQTLNLITRTLNHREVRDRWGDIEVSVEFAERGSAAWALRGRYPKLHFPHAACTPLIVLHEVAHLLKPARREQAPHGPGFTAIHLMLVELMKPALLTPMLAAYRATCTPWDATFIPAGTSTHIPLLGALDITTTRRHLQALATSGALTKKEHARLRALLRDRGNRPAPPPLRDLPAHVQIPTNALLACNSDRDIARLVLDVIAHELTPREMRRPPRKKTARGGTQH